MTDRQRELRERLELPEALLSRTDLAELGLPRRAVEAVFRACATVALPGYSRPFVRVNEYRALVERCTSADVFASGLQPGGSTPARLGSV